MDQVFRSEELHSVVSRLCGYEPRKSSSIGSHLSYQLASFGCFFLSVPKIPRKLCERPFFPKTGRRCSFFDSLVFRRQMQFLSRPGKLRANLEFNFLSRVIILDPRWSFVISGERSNFLQVVSGRESVHFFCLVKKCFVVQPKFFCLVYEWWFYHAKTCMLLLLGRARL